MQCNETHNRAWTEGSSRGLTDGCIPWGFLASPHPQASQREACQNDLLLGYGECKRLH